MASAQQRPLITEDVDIIKPGVIRIESGFEFLQDIKFPLSGLRGDLTKLADTRLSFGLAPNVEFQMEWTVQNFLSIDGRDPSAIPLRLGANSADTNDVGDVTLWMKIKLRNETRLAPALGFRFGVQLANSNQARGIGTNTTNFYGVVTAGKRFANDKLNVFGNIGLGDTRSADCELHSKRRADVRAGWHLHGQRPSKCSWRSQRLSFDSKARAAWHGRLFRSAVGSASTRARTALERGRDFRHVKTRAENGPHNRHHV